MKALAQLLAVTPSRISQLRHGLSRSRRASLELFLGTRKARPKAPRAKLPADMRKHLQRQEGYLAEIPMLRAQVQRLRDELLAFQAGGGRTTADVLSIVRSRLGDEIADSVAEALAAPSSAPDRPRSSRKRR